MNNDEKPGWMKEVVPGALVLTSSEIFGQRRARVRSVLGGIARLECGEVVTIGKRAGSDAIAIVAVFYGKASIRKAGASRFVPLNRSIRPNATEWAARAIAREEGRAL